MSLMLETFGDQLKDISGLKIISYFYDKNQINTGTGTKIWNSSLLFNIYLKEHFKEFEGKNILEIASGTGCGSLALAKYNINHLTLTDMDPVCLENIKENINVNKDLIKTDIIDVFKLNYSKKESFDEFFKNTNLINYDIILGCDVMWSDDQAKAFFKAIDILLSKYKEATIILCNILFYDISEVLSDFVEEGKYDITNIHGKDTREQFKNIEMYIIKNKK